MKGWVGLVGWPVADGLPTEWSLVGYSPSIGQGLFAGQRPAFRQLCYMQPTVIAYVIIIALHSRKVFDTVRHSILLLNLTSLTLSTVALSTSWKTTSTAPTITTERRTDGNLGQCHTGLCNWPGVVCCQRVTHEDSDNCANTRTTLSPSYRRVMSTHVRMKFILLKAGYS